MIGDADSRERPEIVLIAAVAEANRVIGQEKDLPWHIPEDLKHFKRLTAGHSLLMGRKTFESIVHQFGGPLPDRRMLVLTTREGLEGYPEIETFSSVGDALAAVDPSETLFIGGGGAVYDEFLPLADRMELTLIEGEFEGDTFFPPFEHLVGKEFDIDSEDRREGYRFVTYRRKYSAVANE
ncbi:MAG: dihydrofolate reductase [Bacteroidota bacterium]